VRDPGRQIAGRIDRVARRPTQREADAEDQDADQQRAQSTRDAVVSAGNPERTYQQYCRADHFADQIPGSVPDRGHGRKHAQLGHGIFGLRPVRQVGRPNENRSEEAAQELPGQVQRDLVPTQLADHRHADRHGRIEVAATGPTGDVDPHRHGKSPAGRDHDPAAVLALRFLQHDVGHDAVA